MTARPEVGLYEEHIITYVPVHKLLSNVDVRVARVTSFQEVHPVAAFKSGDSVLKTLAGLP